MNKLTYQDCVELKDAGFKSKSRTFILPDGTTYDWMEFKTGGVLLPSLSELIEECGLGFDKLYYRPTGQALDDGKGAWYARKAYPLLYEGIKVPDFRGQSPEQAVKSLYCALNPKK
jgi:hypothetical protein